MGINIQTARHPCRAQEEEEEGCIGLGFFFPEKSVILMDAVWSSHNRILVTNPPGFPTALLYPCLEIRSGELGNVSKHSPESQTLIADE